MTHEARKDKEMKGKLRQEESKGTCIAFVIKGADRQRLIKGK
jgi:hypothetical protein